MPQPGKKIIAMHIFPNISRSKDNQTMKFGQLVEYNMRNNSGKFILEVWRRNYSL